VHAATTLSPAAVQSECRPARLSRVVLLALAFPMWVEQTRGRAITWSILFDFFPDGVVWLPGASARGAVLSLLRLYQRVVKPTR
jgi:hypothetical protein